MKTASLASWLATVEGTEPTVPTWILPESIWCDETLHYVEIALKNVRKVIAQKKELIELMPARAHKTQREADETIMEIARSLQDKLEVKA